MEKVDFIKNDPNKGIRYNWKKIRKEYAKLKCPDIYYNPCECPFEECKYFINYSMRSVGKTTGWFLLGMIMNQMYGTVIQYLRQTETQIAVKHTKDLFNAVKENHYIEKITGGRWNSVHYNARRWYYANVDDTGKVIEVAPEHFMNVLVVTKNQDYKSGYNAPRGDLIIFDEFVSDFYYQDEFISFCDLTKTIIRDRESPVIVMLSNTIDKQSPYYRELEIYDEVQRLQRFESTIKTTTLGTKIYIKYLYAPDSKVNDLKKLNKLFYGFLNKGLGSITGEDWLIRPKQHIPKGEYTTLIRNVYIKHNNQYLNLEFVLHEDLGICLYIHRATTWDSRELYDDSVILTLEDRYDRRYTYGLGTGRLERLMHEMTEQNRVYFQTNDLGSLYDSYINEWNQRR